MKCQEIKISVVREAETEYKITTPKNIYDFWQSEIKKSAWYQDEKEMMIVFILDGKNAVKSYNLVTLGLLNQSSVHAREVFRPAILAGAQQIIIAHNHPSGELKPSESDIIATKGLIAAGEIIGIKLIDHIIIGDGFRSMREEYDVNFI